MVNKTYQANKKKGSKIIMWIIIAGVIFVAHHFLMMALGYTRNCGLV